MRTVDGMYDDSEATAMADDYLALVMRKQIKEETACESMALEYQNSHIHKQYAAALRHADQKREDAQPVTMADLPSKPDPFANIALTPPTWWQLLKRFWREL